MTDENWEGVAFISDHRTVGVRAWCHIDSEWCYELELCPCCDQTRVPPMWQGWRPGELLQALRWRVNALAGAGEEPQRGKNFRVPLDDVLDLLDGVESVESATR